MATKYPAAIDDSSTLPNVVDNASLVKSEILNLFRDAILSIETELGIKPSGVYGTVVERLDALDAALQVETDNRFIATGDISGTPQSQTVVGLQGHPISGTTPSTNSILTWSGAAWTPRQSVNITGNIAGASVHSSLMITDGSTPPAVSGADQGTIYFDSTENKFKVSQNGSAYIDLLTGIVNGLISDINVSPTAAIQGTKISPNFGSQNIVTTGTAQAASLKLGSSGPVIAMGSGAPSAALADGSVYLRTDGTSTTALYTRHGGAWSVVTGGVGSITWAGDLAGSSDVTQTVAKINGASVPAAGSLTTNDVLLVSGASALTYGLLTNSNIDSAAAIAGSKISPNFGSQNIVTTGTSQGGSFIVGASGPTLTKGAGAPSSTPPNGSVYLRTDGYASTGVYTYQSGVWSALSSGFDVSTLPSSSTVSDGDTVPVVVGGVTSQVSISIVRGPPPSVGWTTALDINFNSLSNQSLGADGTYTIGGFAGWKKENTAFERSAAGVISGTGLQILPVASNYTHSLRTAPLLWLPFTSFMPSDIDWMTQVRIWASVSATTSFSGSFTGWFFGVDSDSTAFGYAVMAGDGGSNGFVDYLALQSLLDNNTVSMSGTFTNASTEKTLVLNMNHLAHGTNDPVIYSGPAPTTTFPATSALRPRIGLSHLLNPESDLSSADSGNVGVINRLGLVLGAAQPGGSSNCTVNFNRVRVDYRK